MANTKSAIRRIRIERRNRTYNRFWKTRVKNAVKRALRAVEGGDPAQVREAFDLAQSLIDKAASKGVIHKNSAARKKARLFAKVRALLGA